MRAEKFNFYAKILALTITALLSVMILSVARPASAALFGPKPEQLACPLNYYLAGNGSCVSNVANNLPTYTPGTCPSGSTLTDTGHYVYCVANDGSGNVNPTTQPQLGGRAPPQVNKCAGSIFTRSLSDTGDCYVASFTIFTGASIDSMLATIPSLADKLLNFVITKTVLSDGFNNLYGNLADSVQRGWTLLRDLANIAIIGLFVFIAINIILGIKEFGEKKLIARVLIVAVLINFSYLFTTLIINFSNALSTNIYKQLIVPSIGNSTSQTSNGNTGAAASGIGTKFLSDLKISTAEQASDSFTDTYNAGGGGALFMHVMVAGLVALLSGLALLYAAFLLIARFIAIIFLLVLSAATFASYLLPKTQGILWDKWWNALLKNAFLAPIMLIFLWMALTLSDGVTKILVTDKSAAFSKITTGAISDTSAGLLLNYFLVLGFLFGGIAIANSFSSRLSQRFTASIASIGLGGATTVLGRPIAWNAARNKFKNQKLLEKETDPDKRASLARTIARQDSLSKRDWNFMNTGLAKSAAKIPGLQGLAAGQFKVTPYGKGLDEKAKKLAEIYGPATPTGKLAKDIRGGASAETAAETTAKRQLEATKEEAKRLERMAHASEQTAARQHEDASRQLEEAHRQLAGIETALVGARGPGGDPAEARRLETERETMIRAGTGTIARAQQQANASIQILNQRRAEATAATQVHSDAQTAHTEGVTEIKEAQTKRGDNAIKDYTEVLNRHMTRWVIDPNLKTAAKKKLGTYRSDHNVKEIAEKLKASVETPAATTPTTQNQPAPATETPH